MNYPQWTALPDEKPSAESGAQPKFWLGVSMILIGIIVGFAIGQIILD